MEEKTLEEMLQEETPVTEEASGEMDAGQAPDPETAEETDAEAGQPEADQNNTDDTQDQPDDESDEEETEDGGVRGDSSEVLSLPLLVLIE